MGERKRVEVYLAWEDPGYCRKYYRTLPNRQLLCLLEQEGWHTAIDDDCWNEPNCPINEDKVELVIVEKPQEIE